MSDNQVLRAWEERVVSQEKGSRIVHYIMRDSIGSSLLAVVGRDRCINHMSYVVSDDYLRVFGSTSTVHTGTNWGARRDVVEWLVSVVSRGGPILANSSMYCIVLPCNLNFKLLICSCYGEIKIPLMNS